MLLTDVCRGGLDLCSFADTDGVLGSHIEDVLGDRLQVLNHQLIYIASLPTASHTHVSSTSIILSVSLQSLLQ